MTDSTNEPQPATAEPTPISEATNESSGSNSSDSGATDSGATDSGSTSAQAPLIDVPGPGSFDVANPANAGFVGTETETFADVHKDDNETLGYLGEPKDAEVAYTYLQHLDPARQADPYGTYTDDLEKRKAEANRARIEGREPDFENPGPTGGTPLIPTVAAQQVALPGSVAPVAGYETVSVGVPEDEVAYNAAAAEAHDVNPDGSVKSE